jgi:P pilus assembly chaperone PapD
LLTIEYKLYKVKIRVFDEFSGDFRMSGKFSTTLLLKPFLALGGAVLICLGLPMIGSAQIAVDQGVVVIEGSDKATVVVSNVGTKRAFVEVASRLITTPGTEAENAVNSADPSEVGLLSAPNRLILEPGERRSVRLQTLGDLSGTDRVWRTLVKEVAAPEEEAEGMAIRTVLAYDVLVIQRPTKAASDLKITRAGTKITASNNGNTFLVLDQAKQCVSADQCTDVIGKRLYAGKSHVFEVSDPAAPVTFRVLEVGKAARTIEVK